MTPPAATMLTAALGALNAVTFAAFGIDKARAGSGAPRIREATLLRLAVFGGTPAAYAARRLFRHKTRKQPFTGRLHLIAALQAAAVAAVLWPR